MNNCISRIETANSINYRNELIYIYIYVYWYLYMYIYINICICTKLEAEDLISQSERENDKVLAQKGWGKNKKNEDYVLSLFGLWYSLHSSWRCRFWKKLRSLLYQIVLEDVSIVNDTQSSTNAIFYDLSHWLQLTIT